MRTSINFCGMVVSSGEDRRDDLSSNSACHLG
jgi:hypothetical protein